MVDTNSASGNPIPAASPSASAVPPVIGSSAPTPPQPPVIGRRFRFKKRYVIAGMALLFVGLSVKAVAGYFFMENEATALRKSVSARSVGNCEKKFAFRLGWITTGLVRAGSRLFDIPPEPRAALETVRRVEVGVYSLTEPIAAVRAGEILADADTAMTRRGWDRIVGVIHDQQVVAVYAPHKGLSQSHLECAVLVVDGRDLVIAAGSCNPGPLMELASKKIDKKQFRF